MSDSNTFLKTGQVCEILSISTRTLQRLVSAGKINYYKDGATSPRKFRRRDIDEYINNHMQLT